MLRPYSIEGLYMSYLGLDVGTTGCKAVVFDDRGRQLSSAYREYAIISERE